MNERHVPQRRLGGTDLVVTSLCLGTSALGSMPKQYGYEVDDDLAVRTVLTALESPITFIDTSNGYGAGESERRIGQAIREAGGLPNGYVVATKVDPAPGTKDFSGARVRRSVEESLDRLGLDRLPLLHLHDPERIGFERSMADEGPVAALVELQAEGIVDNLGVAGGPIGLLRRFIATGHFSVVLTHNRWTLLDRSADELLDDAARLGLGVINGAPYSGGILAKGPAAHARYGYRPADQRVLDQAQRIERVCAQYGVPLAAAALQYSTRDSRIDSTVIGVTTPTRIDATIDLLTAPVPDALWEELDGLAAPRDLWLG